MVDKPPVNREEPEDANVPPIERLEDDRVAPSNGMAVPNEAEDCSSESSSSVKSPASKRVRMQNPDAGAEEADTESSRSDSSARDVKSSIAEEFECSLCLKLFYEPITLSCGHTFCRMCLREAVDKYNDTCPLCREVFHMNPSEARVNIVLNSMLERLFPDQIAERRLEAQQATAETDNHLPLFYLNMVCFPLETVPLHIFEQRYRVMVRRCLNGEKAFGLIPLYRTTNSPFSQPSPSEIGTVLKIQRAEFLHDGRILLETVGQSRIRIKRSWEQDGYGMAEVEKIEDEALDEEGKKELSALALEARQLVQEQVTRVEQQCEDSATLRELRSRMEDMSSKSDEELTFVLPAMLPVALHMKLGLLRETTAVDRMRKCVNMLKSQNVFVLTQQNCSIM